MILVLLLLLSNMLCVLALLAPGNLSSCYVSSSGWIGVCSLCVATWDIQTLTFPPRHWRQWRFVENLIAGALAYPSTPPSSFHAGSAQTMYPTLRTCISICDSLWMFDEPKARR